MSLRGWGRIACVWILGCVLGFPAARAGRVTLEWDASPGADGYKLYWGTAVGEFTGSRDVGNVLQYVLDGLDDCTTWFFAVTAYNVAGESDYSNDVTTLPGPVVFGEPIQAATRDTFTWGSPADAKFVRGDLGTVGSYGISRSGDLFAATSLTDAALPPGGAGFYYLLRPAGICTFGSWQSLLGAEPGRDESLP